MPMIILKNRGRQRFLFSLYHDVVCRRTGSCTCRSVRERDAEGRMVTRRYPASVQIDGRSQSGPLPDAVFAVPQVRRAVTKAPHKLVRVILTETEYQAALVKQDEGAEVRRKRVVDARRVEMGMKPVHAKLPEASPEKAIKKPAAPAAPTATARKSSGKE